MMVLKEVTQVEEVNASSQGRYMFKLGLGDILRTTMFGSLMAVSNEILRMPLHMPGHTSIWWMGILLVGKGLVRKFGAGIIMGIVSGILAVVLGLGKEGVFVFFKYFVPGLLIDVLAPLFKFRLESIIVGAICGALTSLSKLAVNLILGILLNVPMLFLTLGLGFTSFTHVLFGAIGGVLAAIVIKRLKPRLSNWD